MPGPRELGGICVDSRLWNKLIGRAVLCHLPAETCWNANLSMSSKLFKVHTEAHCLSVDHSMCQFRPVIYKRTKTFHGIAALVGNA